MRKLVSVKKWPICLIAAMAACSSTADDNMAVHGNAAVDNEAAAEADNAADGAAPSGAENQADAPADGNAAGGGAEGAFRASGTEPFWTLTIGTQMVYDSMEGPDVTVATPTAESTRTGPIYRTPEMTVRVNQVERCLHVSGESGGRTVEVTIGGQTVTGCGNGALPH